MQYLLRFEALADRYHDLLGDQRIVTLLWLGGSFVSTKQDPEDIDVTVFTDAQAVEALKSKPGAKWLTEAFARDKIRPTFNLDTFQINYRPVPAAFRVGEMAQEEIAYFRDRGRYDDWWQRLHPPGMDKQAPTLDSCVAARGYLEVTL